MALLLLLLGMVRATSLIVLEPVAAYANQSEMIGTASCIGLWPLDQDPQGTPSPAAPASFYGPGELNEETCRHGTEVTVARMAAKSGSLIGMDTLDARWLGVVKLAVLFLAALAIHFSMRREPFAAFAHGLVFALVVCDPFNMLFANGLNNSFVALMGVYMTLAAASATMLRGSFTVALSFVWLIGLAALAGSSGQLVILPLILTVVCFLALRQRSSSVFITSLIIAGMLIFLQLGQQQKSPELEDANKANALFATVMSAHTDPRYLAYRLGLAGNCPELVNASAINNRGRILAEECPQAFELSKARIAWVVATEPVMGIRLYLQGLYQSGAWRLPYLGERAEGQFEQLSGIQGLSISQLVSRLPFTVYVLLFTLPLWAGLAAGIWLFSSRHAEHPAMRCLMLGQCLLAILIVVVISSTLLGTGFQEFARRINLAENAAFIGFLLVPCLVYSIYRQDRFYQLRFFHTRSLVLLAGMFWVAACCFLFPPRMELGYGALDVPHNEASSTLTVAASGWAIEPNGIRKIEAVRGDGKRFLLSTAADAQLRRLYPLGANPVRFSGEFELDDSQASRIIEIVVTSDTGMETVIDRRWMNLEPLPDPADPKSAEAAQSVTGP